MIRIINEKGKNIVMGGQQAEMLPGGGFHGGEQTETLPGGGFHGGEQTETLPGGGFHGGRHFPEVVSTAVSRRKLFPEVASINGRLLREDALQCRRILPRAISIDI